MNINEIKEIISIVTSSDITRFSYREHDTDILIERGAGEAAASQPGLPSSRPSAAVVSAPVQQAAAAAQQPVEEPAAKGTEIKAPLVGIFYQKPSPTSESFVKPGDEVKKGQTICIIEAMKVMNEIPAEYDMRIIDILVEDSGLVEYNQPIFIVEKI
jgi:acetyl-CoA carboxylase biotin carboxyl carrier protein